MLDFRADASTAYRGWRRNEMIERLRAIPGVTEASLGMMPGLEWSVYATLETERDASGHPRTLSEFSVSFITPNYFRVTGTALVEGRPPETLSWASATGADQGAMPLEIVVNRALARRLWPDGHVIGARLYVDRGRGLFGQDTYTVVGVADDIHVPGRAMGAMVVYRGLPPRLPGAPVLLRTTIPERELVSSIRRTAADFDRTLKTGTGMPLGALVREVVVGDAYLRESLAPTRFAMALLAAFSAIALVLSGVGLYGVIAYSVSQRTNEIGVRVALGADPGSVMRLVVGDGLRLTMLGVILGVAAAAASTRLLGNLLYGVSPADPASFVAITLLVITIALTASYVPARRAMRIDPTVALRAD